MLYKLNAISIRGTSLKVVFGGHFDTPARKHLVSTYQIRTFININKAKKREDIILYNTMGANKCFASFVVTFSM